MAKKRNKTRKVSASRKSKSAPRKSAAAVNLKSSKRTKPPAKRSSGGQLKSTKTEVVDDARAYQALIKYRSELEKLGSRVRGTSIATRIKKDKLHRKAETVIRLEVDTERDKQWLKRHADEIGYRKDYDGVDTDIVVSKFRTSFAQTTPVEYPDGTPIEGPGGSGTLGTKVIIKIDGKRTAVWLTVAHLASETRSLAATVDIFLSGTTIKIGTVSPEHFFRNDDVDAAFIVPTLPLSKVLPSRIISPPERLTSVTMAGAKNPNAKGLIIALSFNGQITAGSSPNEFLENVVDHFQVRSASGTFAEQGDSGGIVCNGSELIGMLRGAKKSDGTGLVTRLDNIKATTLEFFP